MEEEVTLCVRHPPPPYSLKGPWRFLLLLIMLRGGARIHSPPSRRQPRNLQRDISAPSVPPPPPPDTRGKRWERCPLDTWDTACIDERRGGGAPVSYLVTYEFLETLLYCVPPPLQALKPISIYDGMVSYSRRAERYRCPRTSTIAKTIGKGFRFRMFFKYFFKKV